MNDLLHNRLTGKTVALLSHALNYRSANHNVISSNIANIDTPGYKPKELTFDKALERAVDKSGVSLRKTNPKHFSHYTGQVYQDKVSFSLRTEESAMTGSTQLNIDREMAKMVKNNLLFEASANLLSKKFEALRTAIEAGRR